MRDIHFKITPCYSRYFLIYQSLLLLLSGILLVECPIAWGWKIGLFLIVLCYMFREHALQHRWQQLIFDNQQWRVVFNQQEWACQLLGESLLTDYFFVLRMYIPHLSRQKTWTLFRDSVTTAEYRQLRGLLRSRLDNKQKKTGET